MTLAVTGTSFMFPNVNIMLALAGSIMGTAMTVVMPVMYYNRAYGTSLKHLAMDRAPRMQDDAEPLLEAEGNDDAEGV